MTISDLLDLAIIAGANFTTVFALGLQSRNVNHGDYWWAAGTSVVISYSQLAMLRRVIRPDAGNLELAVCVVSASAAIVSSMWFHRRFIARPARKPAWTVCPDCQGESPTWPASGSGCQTCEDQGGWRD